MEPMNISLGMIMSMAEGLALMIQDATSGECAGCECSSCVALRGLAQVAG